MKIVLAYSGGLDTSVALKWLQDRYSAEVIAFCANIGQFEDMGQIEEKAWKTGASKVYVEDLRHEFILEYAFRALRAHAAYEGKYLLAAPLGRPLIAKRMVEIALAEGADAVAHGATGKGNDQVRFYSSIVALAANLPVIAPVIEWEMRSRADEIAYARQHGIAIPLSDDKLYSIDTNIWGTSIECGPLDDLSLAPAAEVYQITTPPAKAPETSEDVTIGFDEGVPTSLNGRICDPLELVETLNELAGRHGIGRIDILENRLVGIKTRGVYESPAGTVLHMAHRELENLVLDRDTLHFKEMISQKYSELVYYGLWFSRLRRSLDAFIDGDQKRVTGEVSLRLYKGTATVLSRESCLGMYNPSLSTYDAHNTFEQSAGRGFCYIWSMPQRVAALSKSEENVQPGLLASVRLDPETKIDRT